MLLWLHYKKENAKMPLTLAQLRKLRRDKSVTLLDISARTGLPESYLEKIEEGLIIPLESDLDRIHRAIVQAEKERAEEKEDKNSDVEYG